MKNTFKFAAAAVILIAAVLSLTLLDKTVTPAYALEQTMQAFHSIKSIHTRIYYPENPEPALLWAEFDENGQPKRMRASQPAFDPHDGPKEVVWNNNTAQVWSKRTNTLSLIQNAEAAQTIGDFFQNLDPKLLVQKLKNLQQQGVAQIEIRQPTEIAEPITITATLIQEDPYLGHYAIALVDQATKLVISLETLKGDGTLSHKNGHFGPKDFNLIKFFDYNQPFEKEIFSLNVPDDVIIIDQATKAVGLPQDQMKIEDTAIEVVRHFWESINNQDYATAGLMYGGLPAKTIEQYFGKISDGKSIKITSIGPAESHPNPDYKNKAFIVPCMIEYQQKDGQIEKLKFNCIIREVEGQPGQWAISGGI